MQPVERHATHGLKYTGEEYSAFTASVQTEESWLWFMHVMHEQGEEIQTRNW